MIYHYHIWKIIVGDKYNKQFLCNLLDYSTGSFMRDSHEIAMMHLTKSGMEESEFILPPLELQNEFAAFVTQVDKLKFLNNRKNYRKKVEFYLKEHSNNLSVYKLRNNKRLSEGDLKSLEKLL